MGEVNTVELPVLICELTAKLTVDLKEFLTVHGYKCELVSNGKDCQLRAYQEKFSFLVLNIDTINHNGMSVLKYFRFNHPSVKVILTVNSKKRLEELELTTRDLLNLGAADVLFHPYSQTDLLKRLEGDQEHSAWREIRANNKSNDNETEEEINATDDEFTHVKIQDFYSGNVTIFDHYIRLGKNKYLKIIKKGDALDQARLDRYTKNNKVEFLYFKNQDRRTYINFINSILEKFAVNDNVKIETKVAMAKNLTEKYVEEIYTKGLRPQLIEEGQLLCESIHHIVKKDADLNLLLKKYEDYDPPAYAHLFLVTFFSTIISKNLDWSSSRTIQMIGFAGLFHDIGKLKLPAEMRTLTADQMTASQKELYKKHPIYGIELLEKHRAIPQPVIQIIYQHHENMDGTGFPNELSGVKIYPLAKALTLADYFAHLLVKHHLPPLEGLKRLIAGEEKEDLAKFDPTIIRALVKSFIK